MQEAIEHSTVAAVEADGLAAAARRAEAWAGEPFLHMDEDPAEVEEDRPVPRFRAQCPMPTRWAVW